MSKKLHEQILEAIAARSTWEERQRMFYEMRHNGIRRRNKPFPGCADLHFPLADTLIEKLKPFYFQQLYATDTIASFVPKKQMDTAAVTAAALKLDYELKQKSNLETEILTAIDDLLMSGRGTLKVFWDATNQCLAFDAVNPLFIIVPEWTKSPHEADWFVHVMQLSEVQYRANPNYKQDDDFIKSILGKGGEQPTAYTSEKQRREGITEGAGDEQIILWECYQRTKDGWQVETFAPVRCEEPVRPAMRLPYKHGQLPFVSFTMEIKDKGYYSPRGVTEIVAAFETSLTKMWNEKHDAMTFYNRPLYTSEREIPNAANIQMRPGQILPFAIQAVPHAPPPISFDQEMMQTRTTAEYRVSMPDFGIIPQKSDRTATETNAIVSQSGQGNDIRVRIFRMALGRVLKQAWSLVCQYASGEVSYRSDGGFQDVPPEVFQAEFEITPNGSPDSWNKAAQLQKAIARKQIFTGSPFINQAELDKSVLELDDPRLVKRMFQDPQQHQLDETEATAEDITKMLIGFPVAARPSHDNAVRALTTAQFLHQQAVKGAQADPVAVQNLHNYLAGQLKILGQKNPRLARQMAAQIAVILKPAVRGND